MGLVVGFLTKIGGLFLSGAAATGAAAAWLGGAVLVGGYIGLQKLFKIELPQGDSDYSRQRTIRSGTAPIRIIYGKSLVSGPVAFVGAGGTSNQDLYHCIALAGHAVEEIDSIYFDNSEITSAQITSNEVTTHPIFGQVNGTTITYIYKYDGTQTTASTVLSNVFSNWTVDHVGRNVAYLVTKFHFPDDDEDIAEIWNKNTPNDIKALVKGLKIYDPRKDDTSPYYDSGLGVSTHRVNTPSTWEWSDNPALCLADYIRSDEYGMGVPEAKIEWSAVASAADHCSDLQDIPGGGTEARYTCNGVLFGTNTHKQNVEKILSSMNGSLLYVGGKYIMNASQYTAPVITLTADDLVGAVEIQPASKRSERFNKITGIFIDPQQDHKEVEFTPVSIADVVNNRDNGEILNKQIQLSMTNSNTMAQRLAYQLIRKSTDQLVITFPANLKALQLSVGDRVTINLEDVAGSGAGSIGINKVFAVVNYTFSDAPNGGINLTLVEDTESNYYDGTGQIIGTGDYGDDNASANTIDNVLDDIVPPPTNISATGVEHGIEIKWDKPAGNTADQYRVYRADGNETLFSNATQLVIVANNNYLDTFAAGGVEKTYWVKSEKNGILSTELGPANATTLSANSETSNTAGEADAVDRDNVYSDPSDVFDVLNDSTGLQYYADPTADTISVYGNASEDTWGLAFRSDVIEGPALVQFNIYPTKVGKFRIGFTNVLNDTTSANLVANADFYLELDYELDGATRVPKWVIHSNGSDVTVDPSDGVTDIDTFLNDTKNKPRFPVGETKWYKFQGVRVYYSAWNNRFKIKLEDWDTTESEYSGQYTTEWNVSCSPSGWNKKEPVKAFIAFDGYGSDINQAVKITTLTNYADPIPDTITFEDVDFGTKETDGNSDNGLSSGTNASAGGDNADDSNSAVEETLDPLAALNTSAVSTVDVQINWSGTSSSYSNIYIPRPAGSSPYIRYPDGESSIGFTRRSISFAINMAQPFYTPIRNSWPNNTKGEFYLFWGKQAPVFGVGGRFLTSASPVDTTPNNKGLFFAYRKGLTWYAVEPYSLDTESFTPDPIHDIPVFKFIRKSGGTVNTAVGGISNGIYDVQYLLKSSKAILANDLIDIDGQTVIKDDEVRNQKLLDIELEDIPATDISANEAYVITSVGTTDFTLIGASRNDPGIAFLATAAGTGTGTVSDRSIILTEDDQKITTQALGDVGLYTFTEVTALGAQYSVKIDNNGRVAGFGLSSTLPTDTTDPAFSEFYVIADKFQIVDPASTSNNPIQPFTVTAQKIQLGADVEINGDLVTQGTISADRISIDGVTIDTDGSGNLIIKAGGVTNTELANSAISKDKFESGIEPIQVVAVLPAIANQGDMAFLTTDDNLYRYNGTSWTKAITLSEVSDAGALAGLSNIDLSYVTDSGSLAALSNIDLSYVTDAGALAALSNIDLSYVTDSGDLASLNVVTSDYIAANAVIAGKIAAGVITANEIAANTITASQIAANTITASQIAAGSIGAAEISVTNLAAISADLGTVTAGSLDSDLITGDVSQRYALSHFETISISTSATSILSPVIPAASISKRNLVDAILDFTMSRSGGGNDEVGIRLYCWRRSKGEAGILVGTVSSVSTPSGLLQEIKITGDVTDVIGSYGACDSTSNGSSIIDYRFIQSVYFDGTDTVLVLSSPGGSDAWSVSDNVYYSADAFLSSSTQVSYGTRRATSYVIDGGDTQYISIPVKLYFGATTTNTQIDFEAEVYTGATNSTVNFINLSGVLGNVK